ncbi:hypothetical protein OG218_02200 [Kineococcus sp. NBC_00420]|uniref:hypothetical protein n=1 Tax=unclassified Kineococcus TaxID=2621656 RepID=UPI002E1C1C6E
MSGPLAWSTAPSGRPPGDGAPHDGENQDPLRWELLTSATAGAHTGALTRFRCTRPGALEYARQVERFIRLTPVKDGDGLLLAYFGPELAAVAWWTTGEDCYTKLLAYGVHPAYRNRRRTAHELLSRVIGHRRQVAENARPQCPGFLIHGLVHPNNASSFAALEAAQFRRAEDPENSEFIEMQYNAQL